MTLDDMIVYHSLECRDFFNCAWSKKNDPKAAPTIKAMIAQFNLTAEWVAGLVLKASCVMMMREKRSLTVFFVAGSRRRDAVQDDSALCADCARAAEAAQL